MVRVEYSLLIASRNEGRLLRKTVEDVVRHAPPAAFEIVVVDDASGDGSADFLEVLEGDFPLRVLKNRERRGLIFSRAHAADAARGRYLVFLDAHCAVMPGWLEVLAEALEAVENRGIAVPVIYPLDGKTWKFDLRRSPGMACTIENPYLDFHWTSPEPIDGRLCTCTIGGMAWMCSRRWYRFIGELDRGMRSWGGENIDMALRTWIAGGWCVIAERAAVGHAFREKSPDPIPAVDLMQNKIRLAHTVFTAETLDRILKHLAGRAGFVEALDRVYADRETLGLLKGRVERTRRRSEEWLIETFRLPLLDPPLFSEAQEAEESSEVPARIPEPP